MSGGTAEVRFIIQGNRQGSVGVTGSYQKGDVFSEKGDVFSVIEKGNFF